MVFKTIKRGIGLLVLTGALSVVGGVGYGVYSVANYLAPTKQEEPLQKREITFRYDFIKSYIKNYASRTGKRIEIKEGCPDPFDVSHCIAWEEYNDRIVLFPKLLINTGDGIEEIVLKKKQDQVYIRDKTEVIEREFGDTKQKLQEFISPNTDSRKLRSLADYMRGGRYHGR
jgi:hypothetical protein